MAKEAGLGWSTLSVDTSGGVAKDIRNDINSFEFATPRAEQEITGIDKSAVERQLLLADFTITLNFAAFNDAADRIHDVFKTVSSTSVARTVSMTVSGQSLNNECLFTSYDWTRGDDGKFTGKAEGALADGTVPTWS